ncbi:heme exporter protein C [Ferrithrix thermotolerans DSM 19514]|uniref:Heme exporter protein C n=1 Tax=Ferrithrix thermotolerans DSM 19514 TaxID=1121881 RepID=A0A1M4U549_9ACTN|nr:cytochrome c biogenesis protein CcsA [Ferrithrix thermotolerans]SHE51766.1 heme exporter protein C [Ferrithrix thermotolerans DSM 19514]
MNRRRWVAVFGAFALTTVAITYVMGLWVTPPDVFQGNLVRLIYVHPAVAWVAYLAYGVTSLSSIAYLWKKTRNYKWDLLAASSTEVGVVFTALTLITGSIWGRPTWGVWWTWDARLTTTALLLVLYLGYLALRRVTEDREQRAKRGAVAALIAFIDVPIVHQSVVWWKTLHQSATVFNADLNPKIHGEMAWTLLLGFLSFTAVYLWMVIKRYEIAKAEMAAEEQGIEEAIRERVGSL